LDYGARAAGQWIAPHWKRCRWKRKCAASKAEADNAGKLKRAQDIIHTHRLSSLQVKAIAARLSDDTARLELATAAYPRIVDPENFYEVYDAFISFSKVMRLHDRVHQFQRVSPPPPAVPETLTEQEFREMIRALKRESFDQTRKQLAQQIVNNSRKLFLASQVRQMLDCFDFEPSKLEVAKLAYEHTFLCWLWVKCQIKNTA